LSPCKALSFGLFGAANSILEVEKEMPILPVAPVSRLIREAGAKRVSEGARDALAEVLESYGLEVAREAVGWASHAKRKTVKAEDIREAVKRVKPPAISER